MMKKIILPILILLMPISVLAVSNPYPKTQVFDGVVSTPCTRVVWQEAYDRLGIVLPSGWGDAVNWLRNAAKAGYQVGDIAKPNSIAVYSGYYGYGHVAYVTYVSDEYMHVVENNASSEGKHESDVNKTVGYGDGIYLTGFIYITEPKNTTSSSENKLTSSTTTTPNSKKSSNSYLKSLTIEGIDFSFVKDNYFYLIEVPYEIDHITIKGETESSKAKLDSLNNYTLQIGENIINLKVTAEDNSESIYILNINRKENPQKEDNKNIEQENKSVSLENKKSIKWSNYYLIPILGLIILIIVVIIIKHKKR